MFPLAVLLDIDALGNSVLASFVIGIGITVLFSFSLLGVTRSYDMNRDGRTWASIGYGALGGIGFLAFGGAIIYGLILMIFD